MTDSATARVFFVVGFVMGLATTLVAFFCFAVAGGAR